MKLFRLFLFAFLCSLCNLVAAQTISFTFDDPRDSVEADRSAISPRIISALKSAGLRSTLYVCGMRVDTPTGVGLIRSWQNAGHEIANHTYSHRNFSGSISVDEFLKDAEKNAEFLTSNGFQPIRFRFPYLKEGNTFTKRDKARLWIASQGYQSGAVTVDASDWYYDQRLASIPAGDSKKTKALRAAYLDHIFDRANYYNDLAQKHMGRSPAHVLLLHVNEINARYFGDLVTMFRERGWNVVDSKTAYEDPIYSLAPDVLPAGESLIWQIAKDRGDITLRYPGEDAPYEKPKLDKLGL